MKIAIITDGNNELGMGHVYQSLTLAELLTKSLSKNSEIVFLTKSNKNVCEQIFQKGFKVTTYPNDDKIFDALENFKPDRIIFDKLDVAVSLAQKIKEQINCKLIICTNLTEANEYADVTVLADIGSDFKNIYRQDKVTGKTQIWGPKYWLLRPEFYEYKQRGKIIPPSVKNIMMLFGGTDPCNFSSQILNELLHMDSTFDIKLIHGSAFEHKQELNSVINTNKKTKSSLQVLENVKNVAELMYKSDLVFASPGLSFFEALAVGTPVIGFHQNELQRDVYKGYLTTYGQNDINQTCKLIIDKAFIYPSDYYIKMMEIGEGKYEIIDAILN